MTPKTTLAPAAGPAQRHGLARRVLLVFHRYAGLAMAAFLILLSLTGALLSFAGEVDEWLNPDLYAVPADGRPRLDPLALRALAESREPRATVDFLPLDLSPTSTFRAGLAPRTDPSTGKAWDLPFVEVILDPRDGALIAERTGGHFSLDRRDFISLCWRLHFTLGVTDGTVSRWLLGLVALAWTIDCLAAFVLTLPSRRHGQPEEPALRGRLRTFLRRWRPAWLVKLDAGFHRVNFDLHRAVSLWTWAVLFIFAWSGVGFLLRAEVYDPVMRTVFRVPSAPAADDLPVLDPPLATPGLDWAGALEAGRRLSGEAAARLGAAPGPEFYLMLDREHGVYSFAAEWVKGAVRQDGVVTFDAGDGRLRRVEPLAMEAAEAPADTAPLGERISELLFEIHVGSIGGLPWRIGTSVVGLLVLLVTVSGVIIWWKKRSGRRRAAALRSGAVTLLVLVTLPGPALGHAHAAPGSPPPVKQPLPASPVFSLPPGPHAVGFTARDLYDFTRTYRPAFTPLGEPERAERARPMQTSVWYPAAATRAARMRYGDYFALGAHQDGPPTAAQVKRFLAEQEAHWTGEGGAAAKAWYEAIRRAPVRAVRDAAPAAGRFPVVVYNAGGGQPSWDNSVLFEHLASHGYVVIASPSTWNWDRSRPTEDTYEAVEASARDLEFHVGFARTLPYADPARLALMGYSWGGLAAPVVALRNSAVAAVVALDGSITWADELLAKAPHPDPATLQAAFLSLRSSAARGFLAAEARGQQVTPKEREEGLAGEAAFKFYDGLRHADAFRVVMERFHHGNFASHFTILDEDRRPGEPTAEEDQAGYGAMAQYVRAFLDGYVKGDAAARAWLRRAPAENGVPDGVMRVDFKAARPYPPPTAAALARAGRERGFEALPALVEAARKEEPGFGLTDLTAAT